MKLKQISPSIKCPVCKIFSLEWWILGNRDSDYYEIKGKDEDPDAICGTKEKTTNVLRCRLCLGEFLDEENQKRWNERIFK